MSTLGGSSGLVLGFEGMPTFWQGRGRVTAGRAKSGTGMTKMPSAEGMQAGILAPERSAQFHPMLTGCLLTFATYAALQVQN